MITPEEIRKKALRQYKEFCLSFLQDEPFFPLIIPGNKGKSTDPFLKRKKGLESLIKGSKEKIGYGYTLEWKEVNTRKNSTQSLIQTILFTNREDYLKFIRKEKEFKNVSKVATILRQEMPELTRWMIENPYALESPFEIWPNILKVCLWFINNPSPEIYIRQLPIPVHTKFIEENSALLTSLLDFLLPVEHVDLSKRDFARRFHLHWDEPVFRCRFNRHGDEEDISRPLSRFKRNKLAGSPVFIIENKMNFLTFPLENLVLVIWGKGFSVTSLKHIHWLSNRPIYYWGDIDPPGFEILSNVRKYYPKIKSFLMDYKNYNKYKSFAVYCDKGKSNPPDNLTEEEIKLYLYLKENSLKARLEQERIPQEEVLRALKLVLVDS